MTYLNAWKFLQSYADRARAKITIKADVESEGLFWTDELDKTETIWTISIGDDTWASGYDYNEIESCVTDLSEAARFFRNAGLMKEGEAK